MRIIIALCSLIICLHANAEQIQDPFKPYSWVAPVTEVEEDTKSEFDISNAKVSPLTKHPLLSYRVIGVIVANNDNLAVVKSSDKREFFVKKSTPLGSEGGEIIEINHTGLLVQTGEDTIKMPVSNKFEFKNDSN